MTSPRPRPAGRFLIFTGHGKGKTTAALGQMIRASGRGLRCVMFQFIKSPDRSYGEHLFGKRHTLALVRLGKGCTWESRDLRRDAAAARTGWKRAKAALLDRRHDLVVLDEITYPLNWKWLPLRDVAQTLKRRPPWKHAVITGRDCPKALVQLADTVTEMKEIRHAFRKGVASQEGIEL